MRREMKFRAWDRRLKKWVTGSGEGFNLFGECTLIGGILEKSYYCRDVFEHLFEDVEVMQFTGLKDKKGQEVVEGDILDFGQWNDGEGERGVVEWHGSLARFGVDFYSKYGGEGYTGKNQHLVEILQTAEVIGNKFENPDLLYPRGAHTENPS